MSTKNMFDYNESSTCDVKEVCRKACSGHACMRQLDRHASPWQGVNVRVCQPLTSRRNDLLRHDPLRMLSGELCAQSEGRKSMRPVQRNADACVYLDIRASQQNCAG